MRGGLHALFCLLMLFPLSRAQETPAAQASPAPAPGSTAAEAATQPSRPRLKIGVALEGGGALGLAHVGVLQWFEDHHIPIDYIAGTSMGGLVGGLYATGKSPQELRRLVEEQNWDVILGGALPYEVLSFRRKEDKVAFPNSIVLGLRRGLVLPGGLNAGQQISLLIDRETLAYSNVHSFDDFPIPFRCVATDLVSGKQAVFKDGSLSTAMRATMAIPGLFSPIREGEHVYVDGGLVGNLPTDVVRAMGADVVIGVHLQTSPAEADKIQSLFAILGRSIDVVVAGNEIRGLAGADLVVSVGLQDFNSLDYPKSKEIIEKGSEAAAQKSRVLETYSLDDAAWTQYMERRHSHRKNEIAVPQFVKVQGANPVAEKNIERFLQPQAGKPINTGELEGLLTRLTGIGRYDTAGYQLTQKNGQDGLLVTVHEKLYAPPTLQLGFEVDGSESNDVDFTLATRLTFLDVAGYRSEWRTDFIFGNTYGIESELYRPFSPASKWFFAPHAAASSSAFKIYRKSDPLAEYRFNRTEIGGDIGYGFSRFSEVRFGYEVGTLDARLRLGTPEFSSISGRNRGDALPLALRPHRRSRYPAPRSERGVELPVVRHQPRPDQQLSGWRCACRILPAHYQTSVFVRGRRRRDHLRVHRQRLSTVFSRRLQSPQRLRHQRTLWRPVLLLPGGIFARSPHPASAGGKKSLCHRRLRIWQDVRLSRRQQVPQ